MSPPSPSSPYGPSTPDPRAARSFGLVAATYEAGRPGYPSEALAWLVRSPRQQVLEVGAGTGKLTREVVAAGHRVMATEPSPEMLALLRESVPRAWSVRARAEALPAVSRSVDTVLAAQSFHWFDAPTFLRETTRVLRVGGALGLVWHESDLRVPWVRRLAELTEDPRLEAVASVDSAPIAQIDDTGLFETVEHRSFRYWHVLRRQTLRDLVASRSDVVTRGPAAVEALLTAVDDLFEDASAGAELQMPYLTHAFRTVVLPWAYVQPSRTVTVSPRPAEEPEPGPGTSRPGSNGVGTGPT